MFIYIGVNKTVFETVRI